MTTDLWYPNGAEYVEALQFPSHSFRLDELRDGNAQLDHRQLPISVSGQNAIVFKVEFGAVPFAVRCFTSDPGAARDRYLAVERHRQEHALASMVPARWVDDAITIERRPLPVVIMEWVDGETLDNHVGRLVANHPDRLGSLAEAWRAALDRLHASGFAHGDLQHGNVLVDRSGALRFVDFDGAWLRELRHLPPNECGHPNYQHPARHGGIGWDQHVDTFAGFVVYVSLLALQRSPSLWRHNSGDNLIFEAADFSAAPSTPIWHELKRCADDHLDRLLGRLLDLCTSDMPPGLGLADLIDEPEQLWWSNPPIGSTPAALPPPTGPSVPSAQPAADPELPWAMTPVLTPLPAPPAETTGNPESWAPSSTTSAKSSPVTAWGTWDEPTTNGSVVPAPGPWPWTTNSNPAAATPRTPRTRWWRVVIVIGVVALFIVAAASSQ